MNILFGALLLIIILLPGLIFRVSYLSIPYGKKTFRFSIVDELILSLVPTLILQGLGYTITNYFIINVDERRFYNFFTNSNNVFDKGLPDWNISLFFLYTFVLCFISVLLGVWCRKFVQKRKWDIKYPILRFYNDWHYILKGLILDFPGHAGESKNVDNVWIDVIAINRDEAYIYSGWLKEYVLTKDDGLDRIYLKDVQRRKLSKDARPEDEPVIRNISGEEVTIKSDVYLLNNLEVDYDDDTNKHSTQVNQIEEYMDSRYYYMPGDYFIIPYSEIKNINVTYYKERELPSRDI